MKKLNILAFVSLLILASCGSNKQGAENNNEEIQGNIKIDGSSTVYPITEAVAEEFRTAQPKIKVTVGLSGTGGGFKKFGRGEIDINDASRGIKEEEAKNCAASNIKYVELSVAYDGLAVVINPQNNWVTSITTEELKKIWEPEAQGKLTKWNQIRPEWPAEEIHLFGPGVESGTYDYFTEAIVGKSHSSRGDFTASEDDNVLVQGVASDKFALGFFGLAYFHENADKLKLVPVDAMKGKGPITPTIETVRSGEYSPLSRPLFIYVTDGAAKRPEVKTFIKFYLENAEHLVDEIGYNALKKEEYTEQLAKFNAFVATP